MKLRMALAALALGALPLASVSAKNWMATQTATGKGYRSGNPEASARLIEFVSYTCPHCAELEMEADAPLRLQYVQTGKASVEVRHMIRNNIDLTAALLTECGGPARFFGNHHAVLHAQAEWLPKARALTPAQQTRWNSGSFASRMRAIAGDLDFYELMEARGYTRAKLDQCLGDEKRAEAIFTSARANVEEFAVPGTPSFVLNGKLLEGVHSWQSLQVALANATK